jgi:hypothetical protein
VSNIRLAHGASTFLSQTAGTSTQVARLDGVPAGSWLMTWTATLDWGAAQVVGVGCHLAVGGQDVAEADATVGTSGGGNEATVLGSFGSTVQPQPFSVQLLCNPAVNTLSAMHMDSQRIVAIRADSLDVTG